MQLPAYLVFWIFNNCGIIYMPLLHFHSQDWMGHYASLPCDACNYDTYTPFSQQGGTSLSHCFRLKSQTPIQSAVTAPRIAICRVFQASAHYAFQTATYPRSPSRGRDVEPSGQAAVVQTRRWRRHKGLLGRTATVLRKSSVLRFLLQQSVPRPARQGLSRILQYEERREINGTVF